MVSCFIPDGFNKENRNKKTKTNSYIHKKKYARCVQSNSTDSYIKEKNVSFVGASNRWLVSVAI